MMAWTAILLAPFYTVISIFLFVISPLTALGSYFLNLLISIFHIPLWVVRKLEILYIYLGTAFIIGISLGFIFWLVSTCVFSVFSLDRLSTPPSRRKSRASAASSAATTEIDAASIPGTPLFTIPSGSRRDKGWPGLSGTSTSGRSGMGMGALDISPLSPTSLTPGLGLGSDGDGRKGIFPILEEEDEHEEEIRGRRARGKGKKRA